MFLNAVVGGIFFCDTEILFVTNTINGIKESYY